jgi:hypothetical protein
VAGIFLSVPAIAAVMIIGRHLMSDRGISAGGRTRL